MCGTSPWEWEENPYAYTAVDNWCKGCYQKEVFSEQEGSSLPGTTTTLTPMTPMIRAKMKLKNIKRARIRRQAEEDKLNGG